MYNLSTIMKKAWELFRKLELSFSDCLKKAWDNAKRIVKAIKDNNIQEEVHTWYNWTLMNREVKHGSKCLFQVVVDGLKSRTLSYFGYSQTVELGSQN